MRKQWIFALGAIAVAASGTALAGTLSLNGEGIVKYVPDSVQLQFTAREEGATVKDARSKVAQDIATWENQARSLRSQLKDYSTATLGVYSRPETDRQGNSTGRQVMVATQTVSFTLPDLEKLEAVLAAANHAGLSYQLNQQDFFSSNEKALRQQALAAAVEDAREQCRFIAGKLDRGCGEVDALEVSDQGPRPMARMMTMKAESGPAVSIGQESLSVRVHAVFKLK